MVEEAAAALDATDKDVSIGGAGLAAAAIELAVSSRDVRLNHITLPAADVEASAGFYARLGLTQIVANYPEYARLLSPQGEATLSLHHVEKTEGSPRASIHFEVEDVDQTVGRLKREGFVFVCGPVDQPYLWREAIMLDPDGHNVFIYHAGENRLDPPWRLGSEAAKRTDAAISIRLLHTAEIELVEPLWNALREHHTALAPTLDSPRPRGESWARRRAQYETWLAEPGSFILIAEQAGSPVGYAMVHLRSASPTWSSSEQAGEIETLSVLPEMRGQGVGAALLQGVRERLTPLGLGELSLHVLTGNDDATRFYERHGFEPFAVWLRAG